jgi:hypothetical protein
MICTFLNLFSLKKKYRMTRIIDIKNYCWGFVTADNSTPNEVLSLIHHDKLSSKLALLQFPTTLDEKY